MLRTIICCLLLSVFAVSAQSQYTSSLPPKFLIGYGIHVTGGWSLSFDLSLVKQDQIFNSAKDTQAFAHMSMGSTKGTITSASSENTNFVGLGVTWLFPSRLILSGGIELGGKKYTEYNQEAQLAFSSVRFKPGIFGGVGYEMLFAGIDVFSKFVLSLTAGPIVQVGLAL